MNTLEDKIYYVYQLREEGSNTPFYIGKGKDKRLVAHFYPSVLKRKSHKSERIKRILANGGKIIAEKIMENMYEVEALLFEVLYIRKFGRIDNGTGILTNHTNGGDGMSGFKHSDETKRKLSEKLMGNVMSDETRKKLRAAHLGSKRSEETKRKMSWIPSADTKLKRSITNRIGFICLNNPQFKGIYITPFGNFGSIPTLIEWGKVNGIRMDRKNWSKYFKDINMIIPYNRDFIMKSYIGKSFKELGYDFIPKEHLTEEYINTLNIIRELPSLQ